MKTHPFPQLWDQVINMFSTPRILHLILERLELMSAQLDALTAQVAQTLTVEQSAVTLINGIAAEIKAAVLAAEAGDTAQLTNLSSSLQASSTALAAAVTANTVSSSA
jgi:hypothetical protein